MATAAPSLGRRFGRLTALNILANLTTPLASLVDTALLGHLPDIRYLAGVALASVLFEYVYWTFGFLRMGTTGTTAQAVGAGDSAEVHLVLYRGLASAAVLGLALLLLQVAIREAGFGLIAAEPGVESAGREYFDARIWGAPAVLANFALLGWYLGREESRWALAMTAVAHGANIALDYLFIVELGLAARGAGIATAISQYLMLVVGGAIFFFQLRRGEAPPWRWREVLAREPMRRLWAFHQDLILRTVALITAFALFLNFSAMLGTVVLAANTILYRLQTLAAYLIDGAAFATESLAGILHGAGDRRALARLRRLAEVSGLLFALPFALAVWLVPRPIYGLLTSHDPTLGNALEHGPWLVPTLLIGSLAFIYDGYFLGLTRGRPLRNVMLVATLGVFLPVSLLAVRLGSNHLLWLAMVGFMVVRTGALGWLAHRPENAAP